MELEDGKDMVLIPQNFQDHFAEIQEIYGKNIEANIKII